MCGATSEWETLRFQFSVRLINPSPPPLARKRYARHRVPRQGTIKISVNRCWNERSRTKGTVFRAIFAPLLSLLSLSIISFWFFVSTPSIACLESSIESFSHPRFLQILFSLRDLSSLALLSEAEGRKEGETISAMFAPKSGDTKGSSCSMEEAKTSGEGLRRKSIAAFQLICLSWLTPFQTRTWISPPERRLEISTRSSGD